MKADPIFSFAFFTRIGSALNFGIALYIPLLLLAAVGIMKRSIFEIHHGALALLAGR